MDPFFTHLNQALQATKHGDWGHARDLWQRLRTMSAFEPSGFLGGILVARRSGDQAECAQLCALALEHFPQHPMILAENALLAWQRGEAQHAFDLWCRIEAPVQCQSYFTVSFHLWDLWFRNGDQGRADQVFQALLAQSVETFETYIPEFVRHAIRLKRHNPDFFQVYHNYYTDHIRRLDQLSDAAELAILCMNLDAHGEKRSLLVFKWMQHRNFNTMFPIFADNSRFSDFGDLQNRANGILLNQIAKMILDNNALGTVESATLFNMALMLYVIDPETYRRLIAARIADDAPEPPARDPLWVLWNIRRNHRRSQAGSAGPAPKRLRIALCVTGQLRGFEQAAPTWDKLGLADHDVDTYVHTWSVIGRKKPVFAQSHRCFDGQFHVAYNQVFRALGDDLMAQRYPAFMAYLHNPVEEVTEERLQRVYAPAAMVIEDDREPQFASFSAPQKMYYKIESCYDLVRQSGKHYDLIVRLRPDKPVADVQDLDWTRIYDQSAQSNTIFTDRPLMVFWAPSTGLFVGDQFAVGTMGVMDAYSTAYTQTVQAIAADTYAFPKYFLGHMNAAWIGFTHGIAYDCLPNLEFGDLLDPDKIPAHTLLPLLQQDIGDTPRDDMDRLLLSACLNDMG